MSWCRCLTLPLFLGLALTMQARGLSAQQQGQESGTEELMRLMEGLWTDHNLESIPAVFSEDAVYEDVAAGRVMEGREEIRGWLEENFAAVPDFKVEVVRVFATADMVASEWIMSGTQTGDYPTIPATGKAFSVRGASVVQLEAGKVVRCTDYYDMLAFLRQLGVIGNDNG